MMLRTDMALTTDKEFRKYSQKYAKDEQAFFSDFSKAFSKCVAAPHSAHAAADSRFTPLPLPSAGSSTWVSRRRSSRRRSRSRSSRTRRRRRRERRSLVALGPAVP